jgi:hypothetical protein
MARRRGTKDAGDVGPKTTRAKNVLKAFAEARSEAPEFLLSCGVLPELSECVSERLNRVVESLAAQWFAGERHLSDLQSAIRKVARSAEAVDRIQAEVDDLTNAETTAAYLFGVAVGLSIGALPYPVEP